MSGSGLESLAATVRRTEVCRRISRVRGLESERIQIEGSTRFLSIGDQIDFLGETEGLRGEVVRVDREMADIVVEGDHASIKLGEAAVHLGPVELYPSDAWIGRVLNSSGQPLDGRPVQQGQIRTPLFQKPPPAAARRLERLGSSDVEAITTDLRKPCAPKTCRTKSLTSRPRSPTRATTHMSASSSVAKVPSKLDLPTPDPANKPMR